MSKSYLDMDYDEQYEVKKRCYFSLVRVRKWNASEITGWNPNIPRGSYPGVNWRKELISILKPLLKYLPEMFIFDYAGRSAEQVMEMTGANDLESATKFIGRIYPMINHFYMWDVNSTYAVKKECEAQGVENNVEVQEWLDDYKFDLLNVSDVEIEGISTITVGKVLFALGHKKIRVSGRPPVQYLWILDHYEKYANLKPAQLLKTWKEQTSQI